MAGIIELILQEKQTGASRHFTITTEPHKGRSYYDFTVHEKRDGGGTVFLWDGNSNLAHAELRDTVAHDLKWKFTLQEIPPMHSLQIVQLSDPDRALLQRIAEAVEFADKPLPRGAGDLVYPADEDTTPEKYQRPKLHYGTPVTTPHGFGWVLNHKAEDRYRVKLLGGDVSVFQSSKLMPLVTADKLEASERERQRALQIVKDYAELCEQLKEKLADTEVVEKHQVQQKPVIKSGSPVLVPGAAGEPPVLARVTNLQSETAGHRMWWVNRIDGIEQWFDECNLTLLVPAK